MYKSKLFFLLKNLKKHPREILDFEKFVKSPYFNTKPEVIRLFLYIRKYWNASERQQSMKLTKELAFKKVYPKEQKFINWKILECISDLSLLLERFFAHQELKGNQTMVNNLIAEGFKNRGIDQYYFKKIALFERELEENSNGQDADYYLNQMWLNEQAYYHPNHNKYYPKENDSRLITMSEQLDYFFIIKKLKYICEFLTMKKINGLNFLPGLFNEVLLYARASYLNHPLIAAYLAIIHLFETGNKELIPTLKKQLFTLINQQERSCNFDLLLKFLNAIPSFEGRSKLYFEIYKFASDKNLLIENGYISSDHFNNIIHLGCLLGENKWIKEFKENNTKFLKLDKDSLENIDEFFEAYISFYKEDYRDTFIRLDKIKLKDVTYGLRRYTMIFCTLIEGRADIGFKYDITVFGRNFKSYLNRKHRVSEISQSKKIGCLTFLELVLKIYNWEDKNGDKKPLFELLDSHDEIPYRNRLKKKIKSL